MFSWHVQRIYVDALIFLSYYSCRFVKEEISFACGEVMNLISFYEDHNLRLKFNDNLMEMTLIGDFRAPFKY